MTEFTVWFESKRGKQHIVCLTAPDYLAAIHSAKQTLINAGFKKIQFIRCDQMNVIDELDEPEEDEEW